MTRNLWRISSYNSLSEEGGLRYAARWHTAGHKIVYLAESPAGALIEALVHMELNEKTWPLFYDLMQVTFPESVQIETLNVAAKKDWKILPAFTQNLGDEWLSSGRTALARVPSAIMSETWNFLFNPEHPAASQVRIGEIIRAKYDPRLFPKFR